MFGDHQPRRLMQLPSPAIVAKPFPEPQHLLLRGGGERGDRRKRLKEPPEIRHDSGHQGLLQHHLADPNGIWIARMPPGQITSVLAKPIEKATAKIGSKARRK